MIEAVLVGAGENNTKFIIRINDKGKKPDSDNHSKSVLMNGNELISIQYDNDVQHRSGSRITNYCRVYYQ